MSAKYSNYLFSVIISDLASLHVCTVLANLIAIIYESVVYFL